MSLEEISGICNPILRGWITYYVEFYLSALYPLYRHFNKTQVVWAMWKYKRLKGYKTRASQFLENISSRRRTFSFTGRKGQLERLLDGSSVSQEAPVLF